MPDRNLDQSILATDDAVRNRKLIRLIDVPKLKWLPRRRMGRRLSKATVFRWSMATGNRLHTVRVGGMRCTTEAWLWEFFERQGNPGADPKAISQEDQNAAHLKATAELELAGI